MRPRCFLARRSVDVDFRKLLGRKHILLPEENHNCLEVGEGRRGEGEGGNGGGGNREGLRGFNMLKVAVGVSIVKG